MKGKDWQDVVREKMRENNIKQGYLAAEMDRTQGVISHWLNERREPNFKEVSAMLNIVGIDRIILNSDGTLEDLKKFTNVEEVSVKQFSYPLLSNVVAGNFADSFDLFDSTGYEMLESSIKTKGKGFFLRIVGDSMTPKFNEGDIVLIDTGKKPVPGSYVVAVDENNCATFKQYKDLGTLSETGNPHFELVPLNPMHATLSSKNKDIRVVGVAVEHRTYL